MPSSRSRTFRSRIAQLFTSRDRLSQRDFGLAIFLFSTSVLFLGGLLAYIIVRAYWNVQGPRMVLVIPPILLLSTALLFLGSLTIQRAVFFVRHEKQQQFRNCLNLTFLLGGAFFVIQALGLFQVLRRHSLIQTGLENVRQGFNDPSSYGVLFTFVLLHALHFLVAFGILGIVIYKAYLYQYDHEYHWGVHACAVVWHFLGIIWVIMILLFCVVG